MKYILLALLLLTFLVPGSAFGHTVKHNNDIGATLHIDPSDDPVATESSGFYFDIKDTEGSFRIASCSCTVVIFQDGREQYSQQLQTANINVASFQ
jgi:hypothetical protein